MPRIITASEKIVAKDPVMKKIMKVLESVAVVDSSILIQGDSGTGKSLLARHIHNISNRRNGPFIEIDCTTIPEELLESELFGHEKGAFTDAGEVKKGKFELASGGTVFIDMIGDIPLFLQGKLLRVLQERSFERLGSTKTISVDIRIIASSNKDLWELVESKKFREDLFYRLNVVPVNLPPLKDRRFDIPVLAGIFLSRFAIKYSKLFEKFSPEAIEKLMEYDWPGNVRQLENIIERTAATIESNETIEAHQLSIGSWDNTAYIIKSSAGKLLSLEEVEKRYIQKILEITNGHKSKAAEILGINRKTLLIKRNKYNI